MRCYVNTMTPIQSFAKCGKKSTASRLGLTGIRFRGARMCSTDTEGPQSPALLTNPFLEAWELHVW
jgi:hypothetical protein